MLCLYVAYLLADVAWNNIEYDCYNSENPTGIFFSKFFASIPAFAFGFVAAPIGLYASFFILKWTGLCFLATCSAICSGSSRRSSGTGNVVGILVVTEETTVTSGFTVET